MSSTESGFCNARAVLTIVLICVSLSCVACSKLEDAPATSAAPATLANPASVNCTKEGGRLVIEKEPSGDAIGVCLFEDNRQCEEWALLRGQCPKGGIHVAGFATDAERYRAIRGEK